jgi:diguanylate cyclase (GGDEF)-like protein
MSGLGIAEQAALRKNDELVSEFASLQTKVSSLELALAKANRFANYDELTSLPNRRLLLDRFIQAASLAKRHDRLLAMLFFDLNEFKSINDQLGHAVGDKLLQQVAKRLSASIRSTDTACRYGGDEFIVLLTEIENREHAVKVLTKIRAGLAAPYVIDDVSIRMTLSNGLAIYPDDAQSFDDLKQLSDRSMLRNKASARAAKTTTNIWQHQTTEALGTT